MPSLTTMRMRSSAGVESSCSAASRRQGPSSLKPGVLFPPGRRPYPTTLDFYAEVRATTPPPAHGLLKDLFEEITFWDLRAKSLDVKTLPNGTHHATFRIEAQKLKGDATGNERPVPLDDSIEIALSDAGGNSLYHARHRLRSGAQTIELTVVRGTDERTVQVTLASDSQPSPGA